MIIDTHCHYNLEPLFSQWQQHWQKAQACGVGKAVVVGADLISSQRALTIAQQEPNLFAAIGIHPDEGRAADVENHLNEIKKIALTKNSRLIAIGEIGLDYFRLPEDELRTTIIQNQKQLFQTQLELANQLQLPMIVHVRDRETPETQTDDNAYWDTLQLIKVHYQFHRPFILHCVSGPLNYIKQALEMGAYIGVAGNVTYKKADQIRAITQVTPIDRLLVETDAPFLPTQSHRGQICEPWMIEETVKYLVSKLGIHETTAINATKLFFTYEN